MFILNISIEPKERVSLSFVDADHFEYFRLSLFFFVKRKTNMSPPAPPPPLPSTVHIFMHSPVNVPTLSFYFFLIYCYI